MTSQRIYLILLLSILALLIGAGVLAFVFFDILFGDTSARSGDAASAIEEIQSPKRTHQTPVPVVPQTIKDGQIIGPSGRERKFALPPTHVDETSASTDTMDFGILAAASFATNIAITAPIRFNIDCEEYGGPFDFFADGAGLNIFADSGEICLDLRRSLHDVKKDDKLVFEPGGKSFDACDLDRSLVVCMRMYGANPGADVSLGAWNEPVSHAETNNVDGGERFWKWHSQAMAQAGNRRKDKSDPNGAAQSLSDPTDETRNNYYLGNDPRRWFIDLPANLRIEYKNIYEGIDLTCYGDRSRLENVYTIWPGADPSDIRFTFEGADAMRLDDHGNLVLDIECGKIVQHPPLFYQIIEGIPRLVPGGYHLNQRDVHFEMDPYDDTHPLFATHSFGYLSFLGGRGNDQAYAIAVDDKGYAYVTGETFSPTFSSEPPKQRDLRENSDIFVTKYRLADSFPVYTTYLGGNSEDRAFGIAVDKEGNAYICGETLSTDFPVTNAIDGIEPGGSWDAFLLKLDSEGRIADFSSSFGGSGDDRAYGIAIDPSGSIYVAGETTSDDYPTKGGIKTSASAGTFDGFITKLNLVDGNIVYSSYVGGSEDDAVFSVAVDISGSAYLAGETASEDFPQLSASGTKAEFGGLKDAFITKLAPDGRRLAFSTFFGGSGYDRALGVRVDRAGNAYVSGETTSEDLPVTNAMQAVHGGGNLDAFAAKFKPESAELIYSTYIGGEGLDRAFAIAPDRIGKAYIIGATSSTNFPIREALQPQHGGGMWDGFATKLYPGGSTLYSTYIGGESNDFAYAISVAPSGAGEVAGATTSTNLAVVNPMQQDHNGATFDAMLAELPREIQRGPVMKLVPAGGQPGGPDYDYYMSKFEITNTDFVKFLNDAQANPENGRGTNMYFDVSGAVWLAPTMRRHQEEMFDIGDGRIVYDATYPLGTRYAVTPQKPHHDNSYSNHPVVGVSWYGAAKYCNWLTLDTGRGADERCYREGTNSIDWAPVTCSPTNWISGIFTVNERQELLELQGFRLPMDNSATPFSGMNPHFLVPNADYAKFLNDVQGHPSMQTARSMFVDSEGNAWFNPAMRSDEHELFAIKGGMIEYDPSLSPGSRYSVKPGLGFGGNSYSNYPVLGVSWQGAIKYCDWMGRQTPQKYPDLCYYEGTNELDWIPATCSMTNWVSSQFEDDEIEDWLELDGVRLPLAKISMTGIWDNVNMDSFPATNSYANPFNEYYKAASWNGETNRLHGFGRDELNQRDANYLNSGAFSPHDTTAVGFYDGTIHNGVIHTQTNENHYGIYDLSGNATEWLTDLGKVGSIRDRACYGGSWMFSMPGNADRFYVHPHFTDSFRGFRVVSTASTEQMFIARIPYRICLCGAGEGDGCGEEVGEHVVEETEDEEYPEDEYDVLEIDDDDPFDDPEGTVDDEDDDEDDEDDDDDDDEPDEPGPGPVVSPSLL